MSVQKEKLRQLFEALTEDLWEQFGILPSEYADITCFENEWHVWDESAYEAKHSRNIVIKLCSDSVEMDYRVPAAESDRMFHEHHKLIFGSPHNHVSGSFLWLCSYYDRNTDTLVKKTATPLSYRVSPCEAVCSLLKLPWAPETMHTL